MQDGGRGCELRYLAIATVAAHLIAIRERHTGDIPGLSPKSTNYYGSTEYWMREDRRKDIYPGEAQ